jgi:predicted ester cyclase
MSTPEENKALIRRYFEEIFGKGNLDLVDEMCSPDIVNHAAVPERRHGVEGLKAVIGFSRAAQPDQRWTSQRMVAEGDLVVVYGVREGTWQAKGFRGVPTPTDKRVAVELVHIFRIADGKIVEHWAVRDDLGMMQQLGVIPAPGQTQ